MSHGGPAGIFHPGARTRYNVDRDHGVEPQGSPFSHLLIRSLTHLKCSRLLRKMNKCTNEQMDKFLTVLVDSCEGGGNKTLLTGEGEGRS